MKSAVLHMNNKGPAKPVHLHSLISTFVTHSLESRVAKLTTDKISIYLLISELPRTISCGKDRLLSGSYLSYYWPTNKNFVLMAYAQKPPLTHLYLSLSGISHRYQLEQSISVLRDVGWYLSFLFKF